MISPVKRDGKLKCKRGGVFIGWVGKDFSSKDRNKKGYAHLTRPLGGPVDIPARFGLCNSRDNALSIDFDDVDDDLDIRLPVRVFSHPMYLSILNCPCRTSMTSPSSVGSETTWALSKSPLSSLELVLNSLTISNSCILTKTGESALAEHHAYPSLL